jgi:putative transposase
LICVIVHSAGIQDRDGAVMLISRLAHRCLLLKIIWADGGYAGDLVKWVYEFLGWTLAIVKRSDQNKGFVVLPKRWIVERMFAWIGNYRINAKDYCHDVKSSEATVYATSVAMMLKKLHPKS